MKRTDALIREKIGLDSGRTLDLAIKENHKSAVALSRWLIVMRILFPVGAALTLLRSRIGVVPAGTIMGGVLLVLTIASWAKYDAVEISARLWTFRAWVLLRAASLLDRKRPLHLFRYVALALFTVGSFIDLTAGGPKT